MQAALGSVLAFALGYAALDQSPDRGATGLQAYESQFAEAQTTTSDDDRTSYVRRALSPHHPATVQGLRLTETGTGFFVAPQALLTNFHVVEACKALTVGNNTEGEELSAVRTAGNATPDLALLSVDDISARPAQFEASIALETGTGLAIVGYPEHGLPVLQAEIDEVIASPADLVSDQPYYPFAGSVRRGNSGSPVLDDGGNVVGLVRAKIDTVAVYHATGEVVGDIGFAISTGKILDFLAANHVSVQAGAKNVKLTRDELLEKAHNFVRQVGCWN